MKMVFVVILLIVVAFVVIAELQKLDPCFSHVTSCAYDKLVKGNGVIGDNWLDFIVISLIVLVFAWLVAGIIKTKSRSVLHTSVYNADQTRHKYNWRVFWRNLLGILLVGLIIGATFAPVYADKPEPKDKKEMKSDPDKGGRNNLDNEDDGKEDRNNGGKCDDNRGKCNPTYQPTPIPDFNPVITITPQPTRIPVYQPTSKPENATSVPALLVFESGGISGGSKGRR